ncbi:MAG: HAD-IA family hydrolase [Hyphomicrobiaceae bacterium]|nr:HAD-IA family hydrolase [Hyphomicrobiaceae bacterium]
MSRMLIIFDCDGTLVDSQHAIVASMQHAYATVGLPCPPRASVLSIVGLSLPECFEVLSPEQDLATRSELARLYKDGGAWKADDSRVHDPLYPGAGDLVAALAKREDVILGVATGKSRRGVARLVAREGWHGHFLTIQTADDHPSKPHPSMLLKAMADAEVAPERTLMIGDTAYDMAMARNARVRGIGVTWGYHAHAHLTEAGADAICHTFDELTRQIEDHCSGR